MHVVTRSFFMLTVNGGYGLGISRHSSEIINGNKMPSNNVFLKYRIAIEKSRWAVAMVCVDLRLRLRPGKWATLKGRNKESDAGVCEHHYC